MKSILIVEDISETRAWLREAAEASFPGSGIREAAYVREAVYAIKGHCSPSATMRQIGQIA